jgi:hypothetical protein
MTKIVPTVGRVVWFTPSTVHPVPDFLTIDPKQPCAAMVSYVWNDRLVNLTVSRRPAAAILAALRRASPQIV